MTEFGKQSRHGRKHLTACQGELEGSANISPLSTYRLKATYTAYTSSDSESLTAYRYGD